jgi:hypothetical protein
MGATTKPGLLARPLVDRLVESVAATDQERNSSSGPDPAPLLMIGPGPGAAYASPGTHPTPVCTSPPYCTLRKPTHFSCAPVRKWRRPCPTGQRPNATSMMHSSGRADAYGRVPGSVVAADHDDGLGWALSGPWLVGGGISRRRRSTWLVHPRAPMHWTTWWLCCLRTGPWTICLGACTAQETARHSRASSGKR